MALFEDLKAFPTNKKKTPSKFQKFEKNIRVFGPQTS
jgi:hypothetical protein